MDERRDGRGGGICWFVGASYGGTDDQTKRFVSQGIWENGYEGKYLDAVKSMQVGDSIVIKSAYTRKHGLPFDNRGQTVSVMAIKAIGIIKENLGDGRSIKVDWTPIDPPKEWYFYTNQWTVWRVAPENWMARALVSFALDQKPQEIDKFRNAPYWKERFGDKVPDKERFKWTRFYQAMADKLVGYKDNRTALIAKIHSIAASFGGLSILTDQFADGTSGPLKDICPFTTMGIFNRGITDANRKAIALALAQFLGVDEPVPSSFEGIPILNNQRSWFFGYQKNRNPDDLDALWDIFAEALHLSESDEPESRAAFIRAYDNVSGRFSVGWNLTMGLYWIRPWNFPTLDGNSQKYIEKRLAIKIGLNGPKKRCNAHDYLKLLDTLTVRFQEETYPVHSFPELSLAAWRFDDHAPPASTDTLELDEATDQEELELQPLPVVVPIEPYSAENILAEGCFLTRAKLEAVIERLRMKKNLILQGPPGTGKTWLAKRLAFALMGERNEAKLRAVQFHPNLSYEDFVRGWRPAGDGKLSLVDGPFLEIVNAAARMPSVKHVIVIEEINRGNPAQIFGEMLTLLEADKRTPTEALELCYRRAPDERVFIPGNLYVIGTMNIADRSLALVDLALRRRFAFVDLEPTLGEPWRNWVHNQWDIEMSALVEIEKRLQILNDEISADSSLGSQFRIGHSYVTPSVDSQISDAREWFRQVVETEIGPLLNEYWFESSEKPKKARERLLEGF